VFPPRRIEAIIGGGALMDCALRCPPVIPITVPDGGALRPDRVLERRGHRPAAEVFRAKTISKTEL
jgi:hypothetical protein